MLLKDSWRTEFVFDKIRIWFMPTGWRPKDVEESFPVDKIDDLYHFKKYNTEAPIFLKIFCMGLLYTVEDSQKKQIEDIYQVADYNT